MYTNYIHASNWEKSCQPNFSPILVLSFSHIYSVSPSNELYSACTCTCVCVCIDSSLHALSMSSLVDSLASVGISRLRALPASRFYYFYFFFFVNLFLSYIFFPFVPLSIYPSFSPFYSFRNQVHRCTCGFSRARLHRLSVRPETYRKCIN